MKRIYKENKGDKVWWLDDEKSMGEYVFTIDKKNFYNLFADYPDKLSVADWITFGEENEYWVKFFRSRNEEYVMKHVDEIEKLGREDLIRKIMTGE